MVEMEKKMEELERFRVAYEEEEDGRALLMAFIYAMKARMEVPGWILAGVAEKFRYVLGVSRNTWDPFAVSDSVSSELGLDFGGLSAERDRLSGTVDCLMDGYAALVKATKGWRPTPAQVMAEIVFQKAESIEERA